MPAAGPREPATAAIVPWSIYRARVDAEASIDRIFFETSTRREFASAEERGQFRHRWLGRYLDQDADVAFVAVDTSGNAIGYLAGSLDDPARSPRFADLSDFTPFRDLTRNYPAHLHVNVTEAWRSRGVGAALVTTFLDAARMQQSPGAHVITGATAPNRTFYARLGFDELRTLNAGGTPIVFLGRPLVAPAATSGA